MKLTDLLTKSGLLRRFGLILFFCVSSVIMTLASKVDTVGKML